VAVTATVLVILAVIVGPSAGIAAAVRRFAAGDADVRGSAAPARGRLFAWLGPTTSRPAHRRALRSGPRPGIIVGALGAIVGLFWVGFLVVLIAAFMLFADDGHQRSPRAGAARRPARATCPDHARRPGLSERQDGRQHGHGLGAGGWVALLGVDFAVLWGLLAFILNFVPNIGSVLAAFPPALLALLQFGPGRPPWLYWAMSGSTRSSAISSSRT
jgi:AI-2 transport protein TqsA